LGMTDLNGGALFNAEFGIRHRGSTVPERSGVALSFCRRPCFCCSMCLIYIEANFPRNSLSNTLRHHVVDTPSAASLTKLYLQGAFI
jgi:hypothetical protein